MSKISNFITKEFNTIIKDSREYRAYELGVASGYFGLYEYIKIEIGVNKAKEIFKDVIKGEERVNEYFNKLIELDDQPKTKLEVVIESYKEVKDYE